MALSKNAKDLLKKRYCVRPEKPLDVYKRTAETLALGDTKFEKELYNAMYKSIFLPNSPCLMNAGFKKGQLHACFCLPVEDNIQSIYKTLSDMAVIFKSGGGTGFNFSKLRPKGDPLSNGGVTTGVISFLKVYDASTEAVKQGGKRRGAAMGILNYNHPEIENFITSKWNGIGLTNFNLSVMIEDKFMEAVRDDGIIQLEFQGKKYGKPVKARHLFTLICASAWKTGCPGILFKDRINKDNKLYPDVILDTTNPCSEVSLPDYGACCLGSVNLAKFVQKGKFNFKRFKKAIQLAARALINMNVISYYPLPQITKTMKELNPIGVGVMGFADALIKMGIYYDSQECLEFIEELGKYYKEGTESKITKNCFYKRIIAPTGSLSILADCSSGIEPVFERHFQRHLSVGVIEEVRDLYKSKYCKVAMEISPEWHLKVQAKWQEQLDGGLSKTINLPSEADTQDILNIYYKAWELGVKGVTVYREGSKEDVLRRVSKCDDGECHL